MPAAPFFEEHSTHATRQHEIDAMQCRWIIADEDAGAEALMCGALVEPRRPFCADHCARAYMKVVEDEAAEASEQEMVVEDEAEEDTEQEMQEEDSEQEAAE